MCLRRRVHYSDIPGESVTTLLQNYRLVRRENVVITPHMAFFSAEAQQRILDTTIANIEAFLQGRPQNVVSAPG